MNEFPCNTPEGRKALNQFLEETHEFFSDYLQERIACPIRHPTELLNPEIIGKPLNVKEIGPAVYIGYENEEEYKFLTRRVLYGKDASQGFLTEHTLGKPTILEDGNISFGKIGPKKIHSVTSDFDEYMEKYTLWSKAFKQI